MPPILSNVLKTGFICLLLILTASPNSVTGTGQISKCFDNGKWKTYDIKSQLCCKTGGIRNFTEAGSAEDFMCCAGQILNKTTFRCCEDKPFVIDTQDGGCCGQEKYDTTKKLCCSYGKENRINDKLIYSLAFGRISRRQCCGIGTYDEEQEYCARNGTKHVPLPNTMDFCGGKEYNIYKGKCCDGKVSFDHRESDPVHFCCGGESYSELDKNCCPGLNGGNFLIGKHFDCCGSGSFYPKDEFCCNEKVYKKSPTLKCCMDKKVVNITEEKCCESTANFSSNMLKNISKAQSYGKCCGKEDKMQAYDDRQHQCCGGELMAKNESCNECDGKRLEDKHICCHPQPGVGPGISVRINKTGDSDCCLNETSKKFTTINPQEEYCPRPSRLGKIDGPIMVCGRTRYNPSNEHCCSNVVVLKLADAKHSTCCRDKVYDNDTHGCCYGRIIDTKVWQCCEVPRRKIRVAEKCGKVVRCNGNAYDYNTHICCDGVAHFKIDRSGSQYKCCGNKRVLEKEHDAQCCGGKLLNLTTHQCCEGSPLLKSEGCGRVKKTSQTLQRCRAVTQQVGHGRGGVADKQIKDDCTPVIGSGRFPPRDLSDTCSGKRFDPKWQWCYNNTVVPLSEIPVGKCSDDAIQMHSRRHHAKTHMEGLSMNGSVFVFMTTKSPTTLLESSRGDLVLHVPGRITQDFTPRGRSQVGKRVGLLIPLRGTDKCSDTLSQRYRRFVVMTPQVPWRGMIMFHKGVKLLKYNGRFVKQLEIDAFLRRSTRRNDVINWSY